MASYERIRLMELDLDIDLMLKKASESKKKIEDLQATVKKFGAGIKENQKLIQDNSNEMQLAQREINRMQSAYDQLTDEQKKNADVGGQLIKHIERQKDRYSDAQKMVDMLSKSQTEYRKELEYQQSELRKEQKEYSALKRQVDAVNKVFDEQLNIIRTTDGSIEQLAVAISHNRKILSKLPDDLKENSEAAKELNRIINEQDKAYKELNSSMGVNQVHVGDYRGQLEDLFNDLKAGQPVIPALTTAFKGLYAQFIALAMNPIGAFIATLTVLAGFAKYIWEYNSAIKENLNLVKQMTGETAQSADAIRQNIQSIVNTYNKDFKETLQEVKDLAQDFGLTYAQALEEYNIGLAKGGHLNKEFGDSIREYGPLMAQNGYQAKEFISLINTGFDLGIYTDKLPDAIKEAGLSLTEQTKTVRDSMIKAFGTPFTNNILSRIKSGQLSVKDALTEMSTEAKKANLNQQQWAELTASVFRGAGEDAGGAKLIFDAVYQSVEDLQEPLSGVALKQEELRQSFEDLEKAKDNAFKSDSIIKLQTDLEILWNKFLTKVIDNFRIVSQTVIDGVTQINAGLLTFESYVNNVIRAIERISFKNPLKSFNELKNAITNFDWSETYEKNAGDSSAKGQMMRQARNALNGISQVAEEGYKQALKREQKTSTTIKSNNPGHSSVNKNVAKATSNVDQSIKDLEKEKQTHLKNLQEIADAKTKFAIQELENDIDLREQKLKQEGLFVKEIFDANVKLFEDKHALRLKEIEEEKRLNLQKIENERKTEEERIKNLKTTQEEKDKFLKAVNEKAQIEQDLVNQSYNKKMIDNDNTLNVARKENQDKWDASQKEIKRIDEELEFQNKLLKLQEDNASEFETQRVLNEQNYQTELSDLQEKYNTNKLTHEQFLLAKENLDKNSAIKEQELNKAVQDAKLSGYASVFGQIKSLFGEHTALGKASAIAETTINTYKAAQSAYSAMVGIPIVGPTLAEVARGVAVASGLAQVKKIVSTKTKYQDGGLLDGPSHAQGGIPFTINGQSGFEAEGGEYIINKKSTQQFLPLLNLINGKKINPTGLFQNGGIVTSQMRVNAQASNNVDYELFASKIGQRVSEANRNLPSPQVAVTEINKAQGLYAKVEQRGNF